MAITVKKFMVSNDRLTIDVDLEVGAGQIFTGLTLWTEATYKDPAQAVDLTSLLSGATNTETFTISAADMSLDSFEGIYFAEIATDDPDAVIVATASLLKYYSVIASLLATIDLSCLNCNTNFQNALLLDMYVESMVQAICLGRFQDAISFLERVTLFSSPNCDACDSINPEVSSAGNIVSVGVIDCILTT